MMAPFIPSNNSVSAPNFFPKILVTLVAPIFFEPNLRISFLAKAFDNNKPNGIDATRYDKTKYNI